MNAINKRFCVFCGKQPEDKNNEHVIPRWLIELTGDPKRQIQVGPFISQNEPFKQFAFDQLRFPACSKCNDAYAELEGQTKVIMKKLLDQAEVSAQEFDILLDWFDKVRVGLWLGHHHLLDKNFWQIAPNFYISDRIGTTDRLLLIYRTNNDMARVNFVGIGTPAFAHSPTCFTLVVNNFFFTNISTDFVLAKRAGLPYPDSISVRGDNMLVIQPPLLSGGETLEFPIMGYNYDRRCTIVAQPIFKKHLSSMPESYNSDYVRANIFSNGKFRPILQRQTQVHFYPAEETRDWLPKEIHKYNEMLYDASIQTLQLQIEMLRRVRVWIKEDKAEKHLMRYSIKKCIKANSEFIAFLKQEMKTAQ